MDVVEGPQALHRQALEALSHLETGEPGELAAVHVLHGQEIALVLVGDAEVVDLGEVRMTQAGHGAEFVLEQLDGLAVDPTRSQELEGDLPVPEAGVPRQVHRPHAALAKQTHDGIALVDQPARTQRHGGRFVVTLESGHELQFPGGQVRHQ